MNCKKPTKTPSRNSVDRPNSRVCGSSGALPWVHGRVGRARCEPAGADYEKDEILAGSVGPGRRLSDAAVAATAALFASSHRCRPPPPRRSRRQRQRIENATKNIILKE